MPVLLLLLHLFPRLSLLLHPALLVLRLFFLFSPASRRGRGGGWPGGGSGGGGGGSGGGERG
eukprot:9359946-Pyramimonas_sp.AAC.1